MKKILCALLIGLAVLAVFRGGEMRMRNLETRAVHSDEGEQTWTFARLFLYGDYKYDPNGPHGPILYYWPLMFLNEFDEATFDVKDLRKTLLPIYPLTALCIFAIAAIVTRKLKSGKTSPFSACAAGAFAAILFAYSSMSQIYSTYFVQEVFFALFSILFAAAFFFFFKKPSLALAVALGIFAGMMQSTKETAVFVYAACAISFLIVFALKTKSERAEILSAYKNEGALNLLKIFAAFALPAFFIYAAFQSSFGANWRGVWDGAASYVIHFFDKSANPLHSKEFFYYFKLLAGQKADYIFFGETGILALSILGTIFAFARRNHAAIFIAVFAWSSLILLSLVSYKMPWLMLSPLYALCILGGIGVSEIVRIAFKPVWAASLLRISLIILTMSTLNFQMNLARTASVKYPNDPRNPFISVHTLKDSERLVTRVKNSVRVSEESPNVLIAMKNSPWPLPWQFVRHGSTPDIVRNPKSLGDLSKYSIMIYDADFDPFFEGRFSDEVWLQEYFGLRDNLLLRVLIRRDLFEKSIELTD